jgi:hypothetical protein
MNFKSSFDFIVLVAEWWYMVVDIQKCNNCLWCKTFWHYNLLNGSMFFLKFISFYYLFNNDWWSLIWTNSFLFYNCKTPCGYKPFEVSFLENVFSTRVTRLVFLSWTKNGPAKDMLVHSDSLFWFRANQSLS